MCLTVKLAKFFMTQDKLFETEKLFDTHIEIYTWNLFYFEVICTKVDFFTPCFKSYFIVRFDLIFLKGSSVWRNVCKEDHQRKWSIRTFITPLIYFLLPALTIITGAWRLSPTIISITYIQLCLTRTEPNTIRTDFRLTCYIEILL